MPDLREVFEMVKQQAEPDNDSWAEQERRISRAGRNRKLGAYALVAAMTVAGAVLVMSERGDNDAATPATEPSSVAPALDTGFALIDLGGGEPIYTGIISSASGVDVSPDGTRIVYADFASGVGRVVHVADIDGSNVRAFDQTVQASGSVQAPRWSPDGTQVVYQGKGRGNDIGNLYLLDVTTERVTQITDLETRTSSLYYMSPTFSPDGDAVLFTKPTSRTSDGGDPQQHWDLWTVPVTGGDLTLVRRDAIWGDFAPSGDSIVYSEATLVSPFGDLYVARSDGTAARKLVDGSINMSRWSPDGSRIAYTDEGRDGLFVVDVETGDIERILDTAEWPEWADEDTMIVNLAH